MNNKPIIWLLFFYSFLWSETSVKWHKLPDFPNPLGVAGSFVGVHNDALIVGGGANFPLGLPWEKTKDGFNSPKFYTDQIHVLIKDEDKYSWHKSSATLPHILAYGVSIPTDNGIICIGGEWKEHKKEPNTKNYKTTTARLCNSCSEALNI